jgi:hypothetical protein
MLGFALADIACFDVGDRVAIASPGYPCYRNILSALGCEVVEIECGPQTRYQPTAVMLAEQLLQEVPSARIMLVTDRVDLNDQIYKNFRAAGHEPHMVDSGRDLAMHMTSKNTRVLTTTIHKFPTVVQELRRVGAEMPERVFVLVDEAHRTQFGELAARMRQTQRFTNASAAHGRPLTRCNARMTSRMIREHCPLESAAAELLRAAVTDLGLSARAHDKVLRVARTIADLDANDTIGCGHISEAINYRVLDRGLWT